MAASTDETLQPTDRWAHAFCDTTPSQDRPGNYLEEAARAMLQGALPLPGENPGDSASDDNPFTSDPFTSTPPREAPSPPPVRIGKYKLGASLGRGGMGEVFLAVDTQLGRKVAIKLLRPHNATDPIEYSRLLREAQALAALSDIHVVGIHDCGIHDNQVFLAMEYVEGQTMRSWQDTGAHTWRDVLSHYLAAGRGLAAIHAAGLVHRDFKPQNVLVGAAGRVKIVDFGLAVVPGERSPRAAQSLLTRPEARSLLADQLTATSAVLGTPLYISPEQLAAQPLDARSDQFSFCVALYEALYGGHPYAEPTPLLPRDSQAITNDRRSRGAVGTVPSGPPSMISLVSGLLEGRLRRPQKIVIAHRVYRAIERGLARDPADRYPSMNALLADLARDPLRKYGWSAATVALGAMIGAGILLPQSFACTDIEPDFNAAWTPERAEAVTRAFIATGSAHASTAAAHVDRTLTDYRDTWLAARADSCQATHDRNAQDLEVHRRRDTCLDHARDTLIATVDQLTHADATAVESVADTLALLPALDTCTAAFQRQQTCLDAADDPVLRGRLDRARALEISARFPEAEAAAAAVLQDATHHPRLAAEAQLLRGRVLAEQHQASAASDAFKNAYNLSDGAGCDSLAFEAATRHTKLVALSPELPADTGLTWSNIAQSKLGKLPTSARLEADLHSDLGLLLDRRDDLSGPRSERLARAEKEHNRALALRQPAPGEPPTLGLALSYLNLASLARREHPETALEFAQQSLTAFTTLHGPDHPLLWKAHRNLGNVLLSLQRIPEARTELERAIALATTSLGAGHGAIGQMQYTLAITYIDDDPERALVLATAALAVYERELPANNPQRAQPLELLAQIHSDRNQPAQALPYRRQALQLRRNAGPEKRSYAHIELAATLKELGSDDEAQGHIQLAEALLAELDPKPADLVDLIRSVKTTPQI